MKKRFPRGRLEVVLANLKRSLAKRLREAAASLEGSPGGARATRGAGAPADVKAGAALAIATVPTELVPGRFIHHALQSVEVEAPPTVLQQLVDMTATTWTRLGEQHAHWSVLTWPEFMSGQLDVERFFHTGVHDFSVLATFFERSHVIMPTSGKVLELGCGVGRLTHHLAAKFSQVVAVDISKPHLAVAAKHLSEAAIHNVELVHLTSPETLDSLPQVDLFYSIIVLQHNPPPVAYELLSHCLERVAPGGFAYFQVPTYHRGYSFSVADYIQDPNGHMEMHVLPQPTVLALLRRLDFEIMEIQEDGAVGDVNMVSHTFFARRRQA